MQLDIRVLKLRRLSSLAAIPSLEPVVGLVGNEYSLHTLLAFQFRHICLPLVSSKNTMHGERARN